MKFEVSPICLNLIDAEVLARGDWKVVDKWSSQSEDKGIWKAAGRTNSNRKRKQCWTSRSNIQTYSSIFWSWYFSIRMKRLEVALEGHFKRVPILTDDRSVNTFTSDGEPLEPRKSSYLVPLLWHSVWLFGGARNMLWLWRWFLQKVLHWLQNWSDSITRQIFLFHIWLSFN